MLKIIIFFMVSLQVFATAYGSNDLKQFIEEITLEGDINSLEEIPVSISSWITLQVHSSLEVVGLTAALS